MKKPKRKLIGYFRGGFKRPPKKGEKKHALYIHAKQPKK
jgi:hypothetical protein